MRTAFKDQYILRSSFPDVSPDYTQNSHIEFGVVDYSPSKEHSLCFAAKPVLPHAWPLLASVKPHRAPWLKEQYSL